MNPMSSPMAAPPFVGPTPPDRVEMSLEDHLAGALNILRTRPLDAPEMMSLRAFEEAKQEIIQSQLAAAGGGPAGDAPSASSLNGTEQPYGTGFGDDIPGVQYNDDI